MGLCVLLAALGFLEVPNKLGSRTEYIDIKISLSSIARYALFSRKCLILEPKVKENVRIYKSSLHCNVFLTSKLSDVKGDVKICQERCLGGGGLIYSSPWLSANGAEFWGNRVLAYWKKYSACGKV